MNDIPALFASMVFNDTVMRERLPHDIYAALKRTVADGKQLDVTLANVVAAAMRDWAIEKGATHYTHWFQPLTGITAEKHDSFISPKGDGVIMEFSGKELFKGEPDASSFPSGGIRATFEARGYTAWDPTSYAFIKDNTLCIPTAFCAYGGEVLDNKTPLLRSMETINRQAKRILRLFGKLEVNRVLTTVGPEQEYFLIDKALYDKRPDLRFCGRTLLGARPPKGQEMDDHYFGVLRPRVSAFMKELDAELWKLGVPAKTEHNEAAPSQHELAPVYASTNIAADHNQLTMELMKKIATKYDLACLLHEKPFLGINGSGKHNNWSLCTDTGENLLEPGNTPYENAQFLLFLCAVIKAADEYQDLLRVSVAGAGNDHRLGGWEAPPAIISMFLGDELTEILTSIENQSAYAQKEAQELQIGARVLPHFPKDTTDRNRTSPFAFTGNKFEFRMLGSSFSISDTNTILNTAVAEELRQFADALENADDFDTALNGLIRGVLRDHKRIIFNGNNYSDEWVAEAERRGLLNITNSVDALNRLIDPKNIRLFAEHKVLNENELRSRHEILLENYCKTINIEALTLLEMLKRDVVPAVIAYTGEVADSLHRLTQVQMNADLPADLLNRLTVLSAELNRQLADYEDILDHKPRCDRSDAAVYYRDRVLPAMNALRRTVDTLETMVSRQYWPFPSYSEMLYSV